MRNIIICCDGTGNEISENISNVLKLPPLPRPAGVAGGLGPGRPVVDDPDLAELRRAQEDLVELGVVVDRVDVGPVGVDLLRLAGGRAGVADRLELVELGLALRLARASGSGRGLLLGGILRGIRRRGLFLHVVHVHQLGVLGHDAVIRLRRVVVLDQVVPEVPLPDDLARVSSRSASPRGPSRARRTC